MIKQATGTNNETLAAYALAGNWNEVVRSTLFELCTLAKSHEFTECLNLEVDTEHLDVDEFLKSFSSTQNQSDTADWTLTFDKEGFIAKLFNVQDSHQHRILFCSVLSFVNHTRTSLGLKAPFTTGSINQNKPVIIHVYGLKKEQEFGGRNLAIIAAGEDLPEEFGLTDSAFPSETKLKKSIYIIADDSVRICPSSFDLSWGFWGGEYAKPFRLAYAKVLFACIAQHFFSEDKIVLHGVKHLNVSLRSMVNDISTNQLIKLKEAVMWCYNGNESETRLQLLSDRLSLDIPAGGSLLKYGIEHVNTALEQAKSKYSFVIAERNNEYRKELKEVYEDIEQFSSKYAEKSTDLSSGLVKDLLSIAFIFTVGSFAKGAILGDLLQSHGAEVFFTTISIYLILSFIARYLHAAAALSQSKKLLNAWSIKLRSHVPETEITQLIRENMKSPQAHFDHTVLFVGLIHVALAMAAFQSTIVFQWLGL
ncbi:hypothetical protein HWQ46_03115 [Shewanella sp. D64]|uniref:hypothetical protein n=1 Tax=unclassified Shewanella TaxID=196818 RepID=UPI0022BA265F|nr:MULTISPECIES: hypothetical protein [unclassified Shewanella]MEC4724537.1 hypothetical protein [Shewanella sp. D64]MEC4736686.1 hypothetical protein [Shewanella sp. E94]WBJ94644.1 hypothetical protein HWQ47_22755 [Shewanella sp. MTB7]